MSTSDLHHLTTGSTEESTSLEDTTTSEHVYCAPERIIPTTLADMSSSETRETVSTMCVCRMECSVVTNPQVSTCTSDPQVSTCTSDPQVSTCTSDSEQSTAIFTRHGTQVTEKSTIYYFDVR